MSIIPAGVRPANPARISNTALSAAREALVARIDAAADRASTRGLLPGMPSNLISASCFLVEHGVMAPACRGETFFAWDSATSRQYLDGLDHAGREAEIELGREALFVGRRAICRGVLDTARDLAEAGDKLTQAHAASLVAADALRQRWNTNAARPNARLDREAA